MHREVLKGEKTPIVDDFANVDLATFGPAPKSSHHLHDLHLICDQSSACIMVAGLRSETRRSPEGRPGKITGRLSGFPEGFPSRLTNPGRFSSPPQFHDLEELAEEKRSLGKTKPCFRESGALETILMALSVLALSYHGLRYGRSQYSLLENGRPVKGFAAHKAVVTLSLGYSFPRSLVSSLAAGMLLYSLFSRNPRWSLPSIALCLADLTCDVGDAVVASWLFLGNLRLQTAILYTAVTCLVVSVELWLCLGVLRLYECRTFR